MDSDVLFQYELDGLCSIIASEFAPRYDKLWFNLAKVTDFYSQETDLLPLAVANGTIPRGQSLSYKGLLGRRIANSMRKAGLFVGTRRNLGRVATTPVWRTALDQERFYLERSKLKRGPRGTTILTDYDNKYEWRPE